MTVPEQHRPRLVAALVAAALLLAAGLSAACSAESPGSTPVQDERTQTVKVSGAPLVVVQSDAGPVQVSAGDDSSVSVDWKKRAPSKTDAKEMQVNVASSSGMVTVQYHFTGQTSANRDVELAVQMPRGSKLQAATNAGPITVSNLEQGADLRSGGPLTLKNDKGPLSLQTGGGSITVGAADGTVTATTSGGDIKLDGRLAGANLLHTSGGAIGVTLSTGSSLSVTAATSAGTISNDFGFGASGNIGDGSGGSLDLVTSAGNISLHKAK